MQNNYINTSNRQRKKNISYSKHKLYVTTFSLQQDKQKTVVSFLRVKVLGQPSQNIKLLLLSHCRTKHNLQHTTINANRKLRERQDKSEPRSHLTFYHSTLTQKSILKFPPYFQPETQKCLCNIQTAAHQKHKIHLTDKRNSPALITTKSSESTGRKGNYSNNQLPIYFISIKTNKCFCDRNQTNLHHSKKKKRTS